MGTVACLLVSCCLEQFRADILAQVVANLQEQAPQLREQLCVFDNASSVPGVSDLLRANFAHVFQTDRNVGYWSAIDWWLDQLQGTPPDYTYIIESDMVHYAFPRVWDAAALLDHHPDLGAVRLYEYSVANLHLYNKDNPRPDSRREAWQSHTNKVTGRGIVHDRLEGNFWRTNFLTHLPALNRYSAMVEAFAELRKYPHFTELDFQRLYNDQHPYPHIALLDGGIFHCNLGSPFTGAPTGSWSSPEDLKRLGYHPTRFTSIVPRDQYKVSRVR
jgi:hypothetical protein